ncbi:MAG: squalene/phytoene synthase family protein [Gammaproteobacteria bacterium]|nr:squalene/phytoene synthase family protein [Gammaproteobacteria bacterium]
MTVQTVAPLAETPLALQNRLLAGVSRTFALTIPQLPAALRDVVGNAYLLCRIADTIEDDPQLSASAKEQYAYQFVQVLAGTQDAQTFANAVAPQISADMLPLERELILHTPVIVGITQTFSSVQQASLQRCIRIMVDGMVRFQLQPRQHGLRDEAEMAEYCYHVAGVVGEMLTELYCDYSPEMNEQRAALMRLAVGFGQGLQMTNIMKDIHTDHARGACWLPQALFTKHGFSLEDLQPGCQDPGFLKGMHELLGISYGQLCKAMAYTLLIPAHERGLRRFCFWALAMAVSTLRKIQAKPNYRDGREVKITRLQVKFIIASTELAVGGERRLKWLFRTLARGLPAPNDVN